MNSPWLGALAAIVILLLTALLIHLIAAQRENRRMMGRLRQNADRQARDMARLGQALSGVAERLSEVTERQDRLRDAMDASMGALRESSNARLGEVREIVTQKLDGRLQESFQTVNEQLAQVHQGLGQMRELAGEFSQVRKLLGGVKTRGIWGEVQLDALLREMLAPEQFLTNAEIPIGGSTRVEFAVRLPTGGEEVLLPIDSKFPQEDFLRLMDAAEAGDPKAIELNAQRLERAIAEQAKQISDKYIRPPQTTDFAILFLPVESLYAEAMRRDGLCERLQNRYRVLVAGPSTLAALLSSLRAGFRSVRLEKKSVEVFRMLSEIQAEFTRYQEAVQGVRKRMEQTQEALDALDMRTRILGRKLRQTEDEQ